LLTGNLPVRPTVAPQWPDSPGCPRRARTGLWPGLAPGCCVTGRASTTARGAAGACCPTDAYDYIREYDW